MLATAAAGTSQPVLAGLLGLGAAGLAGAVVAMAWSVHARQIRLAELLARRQFILTREPGHRGPGDRGGRRAGPLSRPALRRRNGGDLGCGRRFGVAGCRPGPS